MFLFFLFSIYKVCDHILALQSGARFYPFILIFVAVIVLYSITAFNYLFRHNLKRKLLIIDIKRILVADSSNFSELSIVLFDRKGKFKKFSFRNLENQHLAFIEVLLKINPGIVLDNRTNLN